MATAQRQTRLNGRPIVFPEVRDFNDLFYDVKPWNHPVGSRPAPLLVLPSWEAGTRPGRRRKSTFTVSGYMSVSCGPAGDGPTSFEVKAKPAVLDFIRNQMLHTSNDSCYFEVVVWKDGEALVTCQHNAIIGSHYLAIIDANTIPG